jgi:hypothetical protein
MGGSISVNRYEHSMSSSVEEEDPQSVARRDSWRKSDDETNIGTDQMQIKPIRTKFLAVPTRQYHPFTDYRFGKKLGE